MKYLILIASGLTDQPIPERENKTPIQLAETPNLDRLATLGRSGSVYTIPENLQAGNEVSNLAFLGYNPEEYSIGSATLVAKALGISIAENSAPLCCDFVTLQASHNDMVMKDNTAGYLSDDNAQLLIGALQEQMVNVNLTFHPGRGSRHLVTIQGKPFPGRLNPPHELIGEGIRKYLPTQDEYKELIFIINQAQIILHNHPFNIKRKREDQDVANSIWLWGNGPEANLPTFADNTGKQAAMITGSLQMRGLALAAGIEVVDVEGANGLYNTNLEGKTSAALKALEQKDVVFLHVAGIEDISLHGMLEDKILAIEDLDNLMVGPLLAQLENQNNVKMILSAGHMSSAMLMKYNRDAVPFTVFPSRKGPDDVEIYEEETLMAGGKLFKNGPDLIETFLKDEL